MKRATKPARRTKTKARAGSRRVVIRADDAASIGSTLRGTPGPIYRDAGHSRRTDGFFAPESGPAASLMANGMELRRRARALQRQNPWARNARQTFAAEVIGRGIYPMFKFNPDTWGRTARDLWDDWKDDADVTGLLDYPGIQALVTAGMFEAGEIFIRRILQPADADLSVPVQLQLIEPEHVPFYYTMPLDDGGWIKAGIEFDSLGRRRAYWLYKHHPGEFATSMTFDGYVLTRVPADEIIHLFVPERAEGIRGAPHLARSLLRLWGLDEYDDAEMDRQRMAAMIAGVIELLDPDKAPAKMGELHEASLSGRGGGPFTVVEPGTTTVLGPGESFKPYPAAEIGSNYEAFHRHTLRGAACDSGLTYELLAGDLSQTSYVTLRFGMLAWRKRCEVIRNIINFQFNRRVLGWWMDAAVLGGRLSAPGYATQRRDYQRVAWIPPAWERIQPDREIPADVDACRAGFTTIDRVVAERLGESGADIADEIAAINKRSDKLGLVLDTDPRKGVKPATSRLTEDTAIATEESDASGGGGTKAPSKSSTSTKKTGTTG